MNSEKVVWVQLSNIVDPTLLRALKIIQHEDEISSLFIDGRSLVQLMIKLKKPKKEAAVRCNKINGNSAG